MLVKPHEAVLPLCGMLTESCASAASMLLRVWEGAACLGGQTGSAELGGCKHASALRMPAFTARLQQLSRAACQGEHAMALALAHTMVAVDAEAMMPMISL